MGILRRPTYCISLVSVVLAAILLALWSDRQLAGFRYILPIFLVIAGMVAGFLTGTLAKRRQLADTTRALADKERLLADTVANLSAAEEALRQSRVAYRAIFDNAAEGIFQLATDGSLVAANRALAEIFGFPSPAEMIETVNSGSGDLFLGQKMQAELLPLLRQEQAARTFQLDYRRRNGTPVCLSINVKGLTDASSPRCRIVGVVEDITGRKEVDRLRLERDAAEAAGKSKSDFFATISHEIRTPLNSILGFSQILQAQLGQERLCQYVQAIAASGKTLLRLINDLLDISKIEAGKFEILPSAVDLQRVAREIQLMFMPSVDEKQLKFVVDLDPHLPRTVFLDEVRLRQILVNLLRNAFKFTDRGEHLPVAAGARQVPARGGRPGDRSGRYRHRHSPGKSGNDL